MKKSKAKKKASNSGKTSFLYVAEVREYRGKYLVGKRRVSIRRNVNGAIKTRSDRSTGKEISQTSQPLKISFG